MPGKFFVVLASALLLLSSSPAQEAKREKKVLKNADIVLMSQNHFDDETLLKLIEISDTDFDISGDALIALKKQAVSPAVISAMLEASAKKKLSADEPAPPAAAPAETSSAAPSDPSGAVTPATAPEKTTAANSPSVEAAPTTATTTVAAPAAPALPPAATGTSMGMPVSGGRPMAVAGGGPGMVSQQQLAALQSQLGMLSMGGLMGGGMFSMNYTPEQMPHVFYLDTQVHRDKHEFPPSMAQIAQTKMKTGAPGPGGMALRSLATEGLSFAAMGAGPAGMMAMSAFSMASGFMPGMRSGTPSMTYVWGLPGRKSTRELPDTTPIFQLNYGDIPGVDPDEFEPAVIKLYQTRDNYRLVGATRSKLNTRSMMSGGGPENGKWISEERWPTQVSKEERGFYVLRVNQPLEPGEYAVVLRPVKGYRATPSGLGGHAQVFYSVWDFSVPGAAPEDSRKKKK